jgi:hypothetical protein
LQGFSNKEISKSEFLGMMCAMRSFENTDEVTMKNGYKVMCVCKVGFQHIVNTAMNKKGEGGG